VRRAWAPPWAPHVAGYYDDREFVDGVPQEAEVGARCGQCGATFKRMCASGLVREWIARFAKVHLHRDPMKEGSNAGR
jgi:hypothetical protein